MPLIRNKRKGNISKSGAITISPKNQLAEIDNQQGQIPIDLSIDGSKLLDTKSHFSDDYLNYNFNSQFSNLKGPSAGFPDNDINQNFFISTPNTLGVDYFSSHRISKNSLKDVRLKRNLNKTLDAFKEDDLINLNSQESFYLTSSNPDIIKNFDQPVKDRSIIDINLKSNSSLILEQSQNNDNYSFMSYYNFNSKSWDILGNSIDSHDLEQVFTSQKVTVGFSPSIFGDGIIGTTQKLGTALKEYISGSLCEPISNFGFPTTDKYKSATGQTLFLGNYIDKPFLLEKVIIELSYRASAINSVNNDNLLPFIIGNNFFILNEKETNSRRNFGNIDEIEIKAQLPGTQFRIHSNTLNKIYGRNITSIREIVTYSKIILATTGTYDLSVSNSNYPFEKIESEADYYEYIDSDSFFNFDITDSRKIKVEFPSRISNKSKYFSKFIDIFVGNEFGGRTLRGEDFNRSFYKSNDSYKGNNNKYESTLPGLSLSSLENANRDSPYILLPDDNLIFGFHSLTNALHNHSNNFEIIGDVNVKLIGTPLANYMPKKDVRREFQTSNNLRSAVIGNTYLSDQFETGPIQLYASSSIDRIVTTDSSRDLSRSSSTFYSNGDKGTNKKAVLVTNTDINNVYEDSLLSKNNLKYYFNWRRYGHLSDFITQAKNSANVRIKNSRINYVVEKKYFNVTTGISSASSVSSNSDTYSRITLPFIED